MREIDRKTRKRDQDFKKQQAYLVELKKKHRKFKDDDDQIEKIEPQKIQISEQDAKAVIEQLRIAKATYDNYCKKIEGQKKRVKDWKKTRVISDEKYLDKET